MNVQQETGQTRLDYLKKAMRYCRKQYNKLRELDVDFAYSHCNFAASKAMERTEERYSDIGTYGVEGMVYAGPFTYGLSYLNTGETYDLTILFDSRRERFFIGSWGDFVEANPSLFE